ncbi:hypothetical protein [Geoalkalibacter sp.]|uniref:hypothetical protein n=1 Tax=Geoalkalibacter sp. TaxID=3041440 RepID=UPI00272E56F9|nr:hypothetical protein [Geoalkalibacter sp.]
MTRISGASPLPPKVARYLKTRAIGGPWSLEGTQRRDFRGAVVIPALAEEEALPATLGALAANPTADLADFLVLVVVNHRRDACAEPREENRRVLHRLATGAAAWSGLNLAWVDAASLGRELSEGEGVGLARKIGFDLVLAHLDWSAAPILVSLDADTLVQPDYLPALRVHFRTAQAGGAVLAFQHRPAATPAAEQAIQLYELYLRHYVLGLRLAGSPYAYHSIGSALACRAEAYVAAGGMNRRRAGEDFYFLQQLAKTCGLAQVRGTLVHPSPRISNRTPFGTGPSVAALQAGASGNVRFYGLGAFEVLRQWLEFVRLGAASDQSASGMLAAAAAISAHLGDFLRQSNFAPAWDGLRRQHAGAPERLEHAFREWFDGLKTRRLLFALCEGAGLWGRADEILPPLLARAGLDSCGSIGTYLALLRGVQNFPPSLETKEVAHVRQGIADGAGLAHDGSTQSVAQAPHGAACPPG